MSDRRTLPAADSCWLWLESPDTPIHVASLCIFDAPAKGGATIPEIVEWCRSHPATSRPFNQIIHPRPAPIPAVIETIDNVEIDYHFRHSALPAPGGQRELGMLVSRIHATPLDTRRPMWEVHLIEGLEGGKLALYVKVHHSLLDGVAGVRMLVETFSSGSKQPLVPPPWARELPSRKRGKKAGLDPLSLAPRVVADAWRIERALAELTRASAQPGNPLVGPFEAPRAMMNRPIDSRRRFSTASVDLARISALAEATRTTVNDVVLELCSSAVRRYLADNDELPAKPLTVMCPVSIRPKDSDGSGNAVSMIMANLATDEADPRERLERITASTRAAKDRLRALPKSALVAYSAIAMAPYLLRNLIPGATRTRPMFNFVISNVPGPRTPLYAGQARMQSFFPVSLLFKNEGLNITVLSYDGSVNFGVLACPLSMPHTQNLALHLLDALDELEQAVEAS